MLSWIVQRRRFACIRKKPIEDTIRMRGQIKLALGYLIRRANHSLPPLLVTKHAFHFAAKALERGSIIGDLEDALSKFRRTVTLRYKEDTAVLERLDRGIL